MTEKLAYPLGQPIPPSPNFPVQWESVEQAGQLWQLDRVHFDTPTLPLVAAVWQKEVSSAFNHVAEQYRLPIRLHFLPVNGYLYGNYRPVGLPPAWVLRGMNGIAQVAPGLVALMQQKVGERIAQSYLRQLEPVMSDLAGRWRDVWWPAVDGHLAWWQGFDLAGAALPELVAHLQNSLRRIEQVWEIHFQLIAPCLLVLHQFEEVYRTCFPDAEPLAAFRLLHGHDNSFLQAERALWELSRQAWSMPAVLQLLASQPAHELVASLAHCPEGQIFLAELQAFLQKYGRRGQQVDGLGEASWLEEPTPVLQTLKHLITQPDRDMQTELQLAAAGRAHRLAHARQQLQGLPTQKRFEELLRAAETAVYLHEEHNFWIDQQAMYELRRVFLAIGHRLADMGAMGQASDIFYLQREEILTAVATPSSTQFHPLIQQRQQQLHRAATLTPPAAIGTMPLMLPPASDPLNKAFSKALGSLVPLPATAAPAQSQWRGLAAAPGVARGLARVSHTLDDANQLQPGEILVTVATLPPWTPLFSRAAAVVTETGGILSHAAMIAREVGVPAVVGVANATTSISTGQRIEVDGAAGLVRLL